MKIGKPDKGQVIPELSEGYWGFRTLRHFSFVAEHLKQVLGHVGSPTPVVVPQPYDLRSRCVGSTRR